MKVNSINNRINNSRQTFKGHSSPGVVAISAQYASAREAEKFLNTVRAANMRDVASTNFVSALIYKLAYAGELLGLKNMKKAAEVMQTPEHRILVNRIDRSVDAVLEATGYAESKSLNLVA